MRPEDIKRIYISERVADKLWARHALSMDEVSEVFEHADEPFKVRRSEIVPGSYLIYGRTFAGRYVVVAVFPKGEGKVNIATARDMTNAERDLYKRK